MNAMLEVLFTLAVAGSVVAAILVLSRQVPIEAFPAKWRYRLQKLALSFYLLPFAVAISRLVQLMSAHAPTVPDSSPLSSAGATLTGSFLSGRTIPSGAAIVILGIWAIGAIGFAVRQLYDYRRFTSALARTRIALPERGEAAERLSLVKKELGVKSNVALAASPIIRSPVLVGLWRPVIYFPPTLAADVDLDMVLRHECIHLKRRDLWVKAFALAAGALHWYNPLVHLLRKDIQLWSELSCDEEVVIGMSHAERKRYGITLLNVMAGSGNLPAQFSASLSGDGQQLKRRLTLMLNAKTMKKKTMLLTAAALFLVAGVSTTAAVWASDNTPTVVAEKELAPSEPQATATATVAAAGEKAPVPTAAAEAAAAGPNDEPHPTAAPAGEAEAAPAEEASAVPTVAPAPAGSVHAASETVPGPSIDQAAEAAPVPAGSVHAVSEAVPVPKADQTAVSEPKAVPSVK
ncbi:M56 family metallopeptidase [Cohnella sp. GbtcB17]|uniref:M56 family metallopeptidase n=1 Tax=Cohnella sp. GbtcB17 TaxID=2824762 RepID=UPI001C2F6DB3|nr:M56 family metallopeptidase [Cohnella sp. GbtcB17]